MNILPLLDRLGDTTQTRRNRGITTEIFGDPPFHQYGLWKKERDWIRRQTTKEMDAKGIPWFGTQVIQEFFRHRQDHAMLAKLPILERLANQGSLTGYQKIYKSRDEAVAASTRKYHRSTLEPTRVQSDAFDPSESDLPNTSLEWERQYLSENDDGKRRRRNPKRAKSRFAHLPAASQPSAWQPSELLKFCEERKLDESQLGILKTEIGRASCRERV